VSSSFNFVATLLFPLEGCPQMTTNAIYVAILLLPPLQAMVWIWSTNDCGWTQDDKDAVSRCMR
jgi:hypothetical protein